MQLINVSWMRDWLKCPQLAHYAHELRRGPERKPHTFEVGTLFHEGMAARVGGTSKVLNDGMSLSSWDDVSGEAHDLWYKHKLWLPINAFELPADWRIMGTEIALEHPTLSLQGRLDVLIWWEGKYWSVQWKTYDDDLLGLQERVRLSWHEAAYQLLGESNGFAPWGGTILGACRKLPGYRLVESPTSKTKVKEPVTDEQRIAAFTLHYLARSNRTQYRMARDVEQTLAWMEQQDASDELDASADDYLERRNYDSCFGPFGRARCPYYAVCHEGASITGPQFIDLKARY